MFNVNYNPDVLTCLANLSNDEVFTPPDVANKMLDQLPEELWSNKNITFLDPCTKSGIFLREITKRLLVGLEYEIPDLQERIDHILTKQVFGIGITELTAQLSRRSIYCSRNANQEFSITDSFKNNHGNIYYKNIEHTWKNLKCIYCGASKDLFNRKDFLEQHAYDFIHTDNPKELFNMKFDVIIGNPPYQLDDGGFGKSAKPLYNIFIENAIKLDPKFLSMIVPSRWFAGGKGLNDFRERMLNDRRIKTLVDFTDSRDCFPSVDIAGGVNYFLWDRNYDGRCKVITNHKKKIYEGDRYLNEFSTLIRFSIAVDILRKVKIKEEQTYDNFVSATNPFGLKTNDLFQKDGDFDYLTSKGLGKISKNRVLRNNDIINSWKLITSKASHDHAGQPDKKGMRRVLSKLEILEPNKICSGSYIVVNSFSSKDQALNCKAYMKSKFARFLISLRSFSQDITKDRFSFVPLQNYEKIVDDNYLNRKYNLNSDEINFINNTISEM